MDFSDKLKSFLVELGTKAVIAYLSAQFPFLLRVPFILSLMETVVKKLFKVATDSAELRAYYVFIENHVQEQALAYTKAAIEYERAKGTPDAEEKQLALLAAARNLISFRR